MCEKVASVFPPSLSLKRVVVLLQVRGILGSPSSDEENVTNATATPVQPTYHEVSLAPRPAPHPQRARQLDDYGPTFAFTA